jgi:3-oxoacyl-[acyl-carrier protein] reductase
MELAGKTALVTGAGRGIGRAIAIEFARQGADLCLASRTQAELDSAAEEIRRLGREDLVLPGDATDPESAAQWARNTRERFGRLDVLVNNAGGGVCGDSVAESDPAQWTGILHLNLLSAYLVSRAFIPLMAASGGGKIINVGSGMGHQAKASSSAYNVSKAGMWMLTRCLSLELWEQGIAVNELIPGPVATSLNPQWTPGGPPPFTPSEAVKRPEEVAPLAAWLAAQPPNGPTGQSFSLARRPL